MPYFSRTGNHSFSQFIADFLILFNKVTSASLLLPLTSSKCFQTVAQQFYHNFPGRGTRMDGRNLCGGSWEHIYKLAACTAVSAMIYYSMS